jgi:hypothetical protein
LETEIWQFSPVEKTANMLSNENTDTSRRKELRRQVARATIRQLTSVHALGELAPVAGLDPANRLVAPIAVRLEH